MLDRYLDNILPGVSLSSLSEAYADDIFAAAEDDAVLSVDAALISDVGGAFESKKASRAKAVAAGGELDLPKKKGRPSKKTAATTSVEEE